MFIKILNAHKNPAKRTSEKRCPGKEVSLLSDRVLRVKERDICNNLKSGRLLTCENKS